MNIKYWRFFQIDLPALIAEGVISCFKDEDVDPEVAWSMFRSGLRKIKKKHKEMYLDYMEQDDDEELPKSAISKHREEQDLKESYNKSIEGFEDVLPDGF